jgi:ABC-type amino acid transport system permease subunit
MRDAINLWEVNIFPNPTSQFLNIEIKSSMTEKSNVTMYNDLGQIVYQTLIDQTMHAIDISDINITNGWYIVKVNQGQHVTSKRIFVLK